MVGLVGSAAVPGTGDYLIIGAVAAVVTFVATPLVGRLARWRGLAVPPDRADGAHAADPGDRRPGDVRRLHRRLRRGPLARPLRLAVRPQLRAARHHRSRPSSSSSSGFIDDIHGSMPPAKVTAIVLAGLVLVQYGVTMYYFRVPFLDDIFLSSDWTPLVTVLWLLGMTQAINLIDGLDGLAAGIVAIAAGSFFLYAQKLSDLDLLASTELRPARGDHRRRRVPRVPAAQLQPGADHHGRQRRAAARPADGGVDERRRWAGRPERHRASSARRTSSSPRW